MEIKILCFDVRKRVFKEVHTLLDKNIASQRKKREGKERKLLINV